MLRRLAERLARLRGGPQRDVARLEETIAVSNDPDGGGGYDTEYRVVNARDGRVLIAGSSHRFTRELLP